MHGLCKIVLVTNQSKDGHNILGTSCQALPTSAAMCIENDVLFGCTRCQFYSCNSWETLFFRKRVAVLVYAPLLATIWYVCLRYVNYMPMCARHYEVTTGDGWDPAR